MKDFGLEVHKSHGGDSRPAHDGYPHTEEQYRQAFAAEEWGCKRFGKEPDLTVGRFDPGYDMTLTVDFKHIGFCPDGSPREVGHVVVNPGELKADRFVGIAGSIETGFRFLGWATKDDMLRRPMQDFGYGMKYAIHTRNLRKMGGL